MPINIRCENPQCQKPLRMDDRLAGKRIKCAACNHVMLVPATVEPELAPLESVAPPPPEPSAPPSAPVQPPPRKAGVLGRLVAAGCWLASLAILLLFLETIAQGFVQAAAKGITDDPALELGATYDWGVPLLSNVLEHSIPLSRSVGKLLSRSQSPEWHLILGASVLAGLALLVETISFALMLARGGRPFVSLFWLLFGGVLLLGMLATGYVFIYQIVMPRRGLDSDPASVRPAPDPSEPRSLPAGSDDSVEARKAMAGWVWHFAVYASAIGILALLNAAVAFVVLLCKSGLGFVFGWYKACFGSFVLCAVLAGLGLVFIWKSPDVAKQNANSLALAGAVLLAGAAVLALLVNFVGIPACVSVLVYKLWEQVQDGEARTTPGKALGFLFIPFFNFYWSFVALPGLATELNRCAQRRGLRVKPASKGLMVAYCVLSILSLVPYLGILTDLIKLGVAPAAFGSATRVGVALAETAAA